MIKALLLLVAASALAVAQAASVSGTLAGYEISSAELGSCRLKGISTSSTNYKYYASVSAKDVTINAGCSRCIDVTLSSNASAKVTAYVVDVSSSSSSGSVKLSDSGMTALGVDTESTTTKVSYQFVACPSSFLSGNIKACLMEGGSNAYIPLQFYNAKQIITNVTIDGFVATMNSDSYLYSVTTGVGDNNSTSWYTSMTVSMAASGSGDNVTGTFAFTNTSGCATSNVQFATSGSLADSSASSDDGSTSSSVSSGNLAAILGGIFGGIAAVLIVVILVVMIRRRRFSSPDDGTPKDDGMSALSPKVKAAGAVGAFGSSYDDDDAAAAQAMSSHTDPDSPSNEYLEAGTPAALAKAAATAAPKEMIVPVPVSVQEAKPPVREVEPQPRSTFRFSRNPSTSPRRSSINPVKNSVPPVATLPPPVVPVYHETVEDEDRSSFDIDDMRESEANHNTEREVSRGRYPSYDEGNNAGQYSAPYSYGAQTVTSPQSYVRATSLRRNTGTSRPSRVSSQVAAPTVARNNGTTFSDASTTSFAQPRSTTSYSDAPSSYAAGAPQRGPLTYSDANSSTEAPRSTATYSDAPSSYAVPNTNEGPYDSARGTNDFSNSFRGSTSGGYSRDSLNILGYPYAKKSSRNVNQN